MERSLRRNVVILVKHDVLSVFEICWKAVTENESWKMILVNIIWFVFIIFLYEKCRNYGRQS